MDYADAERVGLVETVAADRSGVSLAISADLVTALQLRGAAEPWRMAFRFFASDPSTTSITYGELDARARTIGSHLSALGVRGQPILIVHSPGLEYVAALFGCWYAGAIAVPAYPPKGDRLGARLRGIAADSGARFALISRAELELLDAASGTHAAGPQWNVEWIATDDLTDPASQVMPTLAPPGADAVALLQYTSGSTSAPKGVVLSHGHFIQNIEAIADRAELTSDDRVVSWLPPYHDMGLVTGILLPVLLGCEATLMPPAAFLQRPHRWLQAITDFRATASAAPNFAYELCARRITRQQRSRLDLSTWRTAPMGAERVRPETIERFAGAFAEVGFRKSSLMPCYGLAEATLGVSLGAKGAPLFTESVDAGELGNGRVVPAKEGSPKVTVVGCGGVLSNTDVRVVDPESRRPKDEGELGELWVHSPSVGLGYWGKSGEANDAVFRATIERGPENASLPYLRTGDFGFIRGGELYVTGRIKDLIVLSGYNHHPDDIEATVDGAHPTPYVAGTVAFSLDTQGDERLVVVQEVPRDVSIDLAEAAKAIRDAVATGHQLAVHDVVLVAPGSVPKTSSGKVQRGLCRTLYQNGQLEVLARFPVAPAAEPAPSSALTDRVRALMTELLGVEDIQASDDFFGLGGDSLIATQFVSRVRERMGVEIPLRAVFEARTAAGVAALIERLPVREAGESPGSHADLRRRDGKLALTFSQERMWFLHQVDPQSAAYNVAGATTIEGHLDVAALTRALDAVVARHEVLRSNYIAIDGEPCVRVASVVRPPLPVVDLSRDPAPETRAAALASQLAAAPFDVARDLLLRVTLYRLGAERHVLATSMHHLVTDAWSMGVLLRESFAFYNAFLTGDAPPAMKTEFGYFDYAEWQRQTYARDRLGVDLEYWKQALAGVEPLELPTDRPRATRRSARGGFEPVELAPDLLRAVRELGVRHGATPFMVLLAAFDLLLYRYTGQSDITVGVPVANRNQLASEDLVGTLVNTLPVRVRCDAELSFVELLGRVRDAALSAYAHQDVPFERIVAAMPVERRPGQSPLIQVMFDYQNTPMPAGRALGLAVRPLAVERGASQFDLSLLVLDTDLGQMAGVEYSSELFDRVTIRRLLGHFQTLLESVVRDANMPTGAIPLLTAPERLELLTAANSTFSLPPVTQGVSERIAARAAETPAAPVVTDTDGSLSYGDLWEQSTALAERLRDLGAGPGAKVVVLLERSRRLPVALLAVLLTGAAYVPIDPRYPSARIRFVLEDAAAPVVITEPRFAALVPSDSPVSAVLLGEGASSPAAPSPSPPQQRRSFAALSDPAYVLYTSGSTGKPKGVVVSSGALANFLRSMEHTPGIRPGDRVLAVTTIAFDIAGLEIWLPLVTGASVHIAPSELLADGPRLRELVERVRPTVMQATPATWRLLIEAGWAGDPCMKVLCGGEAFPRDLADELIARTGSVWNMYGPTETTIWSTLQRVTPGSGPVPIGLPIDRTRIYVLDARRALVPLGVPGEIYIGGDGVADGYFGRPELTQERFVADPHAPEGGARMYRTGDRGRMRGDFVLEHMGRLDHQIKLRGFRIEPGEIEAALVESGVLREAVVIVREERPGHPQLVAYCTATPESPDALRVGDPQSIRDALRARLPAYMVPSAFVMLAALPRTPNGKIDRAALPAPERGPSIHASERLAPRDDMEAALARVWAETLGTTNLSVRDDFFLMGGDSLMAVRLLARVERELGTNVPLATLLESPTIEGLATQIRALRPRAPVAESAPKGSRLEHLVIVQPGTEKGPPLVCVHGAGGQVLNMTAIARHVGADRPFYGLQARGVDGVSDPFATIEEMATAYLAELRLRQPHGPYYLSGYCGGGIVAFEMARLLQHAGESIASLVLIDTYRPGSVPRAGRIERLARVADRGVDGFSSRASAWAGRHRDDIQKRARIAYHRLQREPVPHELRDFWLTWSFLRAAEQYRPRVFRGRLTVLRAAERDHLLADAPLDLGWGGLATDGVEVLDIPGNHDTLAREPNVASLASTLRARFGT